MILVRFLGLDVWWLRHRVRRRIAERAHLEAALEQNRRELRDLIAASDRLIAFYS